MKRYLLFVCVSLGLMACNEDLKLFEQKNADEITKIKIYLEDNQLETSPAVASEAMIYLSNNKSGNPYMYSTKADKEGKLDLIYQPKEKEGVFLIGKYTDANGVLFENKDEIKFNQLPSPNTKGEVELLLKPRYPKGVIKVILKDGSVPIVGADVYLFANAKQASTIKDATPQGVVKNAKTNSKGIALFYNLEKGNYYIIAKSTGVESYLLTTQQTQEITDINTDNYPNTLKVIALDYPVPATSKSEIKVEVKESIGNLPLANFQVYLFTSLLQANTVYNDEVEGYIQATKTDATGSSSLKNVEIGIYYVGVRGAIGGRPKATLNPQKVEITSNGSTKVVPTFLF